MTKAEAVAKRLEERGEQGLTFDYALPQEWLNEQARKLAYSTWLPDGTWNAQACFDLAYQRILGQTVWAYPKGSIFGMPYPITEDGDRVARLLRW